MLLNLISGLKWAHMTYILICLHPNLYSTRQFGNRVRLPANAFHKSPSDIGHPCSNLQWLDGRHLSSFQLQIYRWIQLKFRKDKSKTTLESNKPIRRRSFYPLSLPSFFCNEVHPVIQVYIPQISDPHIVHRTLLLVIHSIQTSVSLSVSPLIVICDPFCHM